MFLPIRSRSFCWLRILSYRFFIPYLNAEVEISSPHASYRRWHRYCARGWIHCCSPWCHYVLGIIQDLSRFENYYGFCVTLNPYIHVFLKGIEAVSYILDKYSTYSLELKDLIILSLRYLLNHNFFMYEGGVLFTTSRGIDSPSFANIFVLRWEEFFIFSEHNPFLENVV